MEKIDKEKQKELHFYFKKIENYFEDKKKVILQYKHIPLEEILKNAPKYYMLISLIEKVNIFLSKDNEWLKHFVIGNKIKFDYDSYERWKKGKAYRQSGYSNTQAPSKWIHVLQEYFLDLLEAIQILLMMEFYIKDEEYKKFLKNNPEIYYKIRANYIRSSVPSENIEKIFEIIDFLLNTSIEHNFLNTLVVNSTLCMKVYRKIDKSEIFNLLKQKEFYIKYHLEYLKRTSFLNRPKIPYEEDVIKVAEDFLKTLSDLRLTYKEYKNRIILKHENAKI